jgi:hypothetical protein
VKLLRLLDSPVSVLAMLNLFPALEVLFEVPSLGRPSGIRLEASRATTSDMTTSEACQRAKGNSVSMGNVKCMRRDAMALFIAQ